MAALELVYLEELCAAPGFVCLQESVLCMVYNFFFFDLFRNRFVCLCYFETCSKHRNKLPKHLVLVS